MLDIVAQIMDTVKAGMGNGGSSHDQYIEKSIRSGDVVDPIRVTVSQRMPLTVYNGFDACN